SNEKKIRSIAISGTIGQAKYVGQLIANLSQEELEHTAIVLGDEALLLPLLSSLPANVKNINITMGLPLDQVPDASFFDAWLNLHQQMNKDAFICKDLLSFLTQGHSERLLGEDAALIRKKIEQKNLIYINSETLIAICINNTNAAHALFDLWNDNAAKAITASLNVIKLLKNLLIPSKNWLQLEYLFCFQEIFSQLYDLTKQYHYLDNLKSLHYFYRELLSKETLDFRGDPYAGLQIMGVLESRVLDFKNVIVTSLNEGTLPSGKSQGSFIPFDLKMEYKLPTYREKDAVYAYHFFRLMQRAENIYLLYNNESTGIHSAEKSRFLLQMEIDKQPNHRFTEISANATINITQKTPKSVEKTPAMITKLKEQAAKGFSPSALTTYIRNPIDFYYRYVLGIDELDAVEDVVAHNTLGTIVHETLEQLYVPYLNQELNTTHLKAMRATIPKTVEKQFEKLYNLENVKTGKNLIIYNVALQFVENLLKKEILELEAGNTVRVKSCEQKFTATLKSEPFLINLRGTVDRMDIVNETQRIIDYKTGNVTATELKLKDWELLTTDYKKHGKAFQVLCYALMLHKTHGLPENLEAGVISFKNLNSGFLRFQEDKNADINEDLMHKFEGFVIQLIHQILDLKSPFVEKDINQ
ncbi:MAG TPA: PD-(D/E)XK nuclease family protein, partial [Leeuwenhoekiella sp.]|nr:PD-(D/E)XK nuclease family protein [Leeuwenhoekiella sp.]